MTIKVNGSTVVNSSRNMTAAQVNGTYTTLKPLTTAVSATGSSYAIDCSKPFYNMTMNANTSFSFSNTNTHHNAVVHVQLYTSSNNYVPSWSSDVDWPDDNEPNWASHRVWMLAFYVGFYDGVNLPRVRGLAIPYDDQD